MSGTVSSRRKSSKKRRTFILCLIAILAMTTFQGARNLILGDSRPTPSFYISVQGSLSTKDKSVEYRIAGRNLDNATMRLMRIDPREILSMSEPKGELDEKKPLEFKSAKLVKEWTLKIKQSKFDEWSDVKEKIDNPGPGFYIISATINSVKEGNAFFVSDIALITKRDNKNLLAFVVDRETGEKLSGATVTSIKDGETLFEGETGSDGLVELKLNKDISSSKIPTVATWKNHVAIVDMYWWWYGSSIGHRIYVVTDRPVYRPDNKVNFKATVRKADGNLYSLPEEKEASVEIRDPKGNTVYKETLPLNEAGSLTGSFTLGAEPPIGSYYITVAAGGDSDYRNFEVEEYRKPEYEVIVKSGTDVAIQGKELTFDIESKYYFGEPVKEADITYRITRAPQWSWRYKGSYSWYYDEDYSYYGYSESVSQGKGKLDDKGHFTVKIKPENIDRDYRYTLTAEVTDKGRRMIAGSGSTLVVRAEYKLYVSTDNYMYRPSDRIIVKGEAEDHSGKPVPGRKVKFSITRVEWDSKRGYERIAKNIITREVETGKDGIASFDFVPDMSGYFEINASSKDSIGNDVTAWDSVYVTSVDDPVSFWSDGLKIVLDKSEYKVGDIARALISSNNAGASALVTVEADSIYKKAVLDMPTGSALFEFEVTEKMMPNSYISVALISKNNFYTTNLNMVVPPSEKFLNIEILTDKKQYRPGDPATFKVKVTGADGKPVRNTEISLSVVDEAIYAIQAENAPDIRQFFYGRRGNNIQTNCSLWFYGYDYGEKAKDMMFDKSESVMAEEAPSPAPMAKKAKAAGRAGDEENFAEAKIRSDFRDTAYWGAQITTDADGIAKASFTMPDSLTTWRATARAISPETKVGNSTEKTIVRKNLLVRLETPRFFTQGDKQNITAVVHNYLSEAKKVKCILNAKGLKLSDESEKYINVPAGGDVRVEWHATVDSPQTAWVTVKALTDEESDAMQLDIPVLPFGIRRTIAEAGEIDKGSKTQKITVPASAIKGASKLRISLSPSIAAAMFESLDYLIGYPYGCVEQTMSRFLPDIVVEQAMQKMNLPKNEKFKELPKMVTQGLQRLGNLQHSDGGWGWWEHDETHPFMTAYVIYGLSQATKADYPVDSEMYKRGIATLKALMGKEKDPATLAYMLFALDSAGENDAKTLNKLFKGAANLNSYSQALVAIVLENNGRHDDAMSLIGKLEKSAKRSATNARWEGKSYHYGWMDNTVESTAFILKAFIRVDPENDIIPLIVRYLVASRNGDHWYSTKDTAAAVFALTDFVVKKENLKPDVKFAVRLNGEELLTRSFTEKDVYLPAVVLDIPDTEGKLKSGDNSIEIETLSGKGRIYYTAALEYFDSRQEIKAQNDGIKVSRFYSFDAEGKKKLTTRSILKPGDEIYVHITVQPGAIYEYVIIEDMLPSGFEVVKEEHDQPYYWGYWRWWYPHKEIRDEKVAFFATSFYEKDYTLDYRIRAEVPGAVSALPARAWLMYFPEVGGNSNSYTFNVKE